MPHQCTGCDETYPDGTESILSGCEACAGTTFQYIPTQSMPAPDSDTAEPTHTSETPCTEADGHLGGGFIRTGEGGAAPEDPSQHDARTEIAPLDGLPSAPADTPDVDLDVLRTELNRQFEGIHIVAPGHYELNLMELYRRQECIITLHDDGRYAIGVPGDSAFSLEPTED